MVTFLSWDLKKGGFVTCWGFISHLNDCISVVLHHNKVNLVSLGRQFIALIIFVGKNIKSNLD